MYVDVGLYVDVYVVVDVDVNIDVDMDVARCYFSFACLAKCQNVFSFKTALNLHTNDVYYQSKL